jgi:catechol 2,3-dioxygenase-like lactoylglutathione lyase family enzyme
MARAPDGSDMFEVVRFHSPSAGAQEPAPAPNRPGLRHIAFTVDDVRGVVDRVREAGWDTVGEIVACPCSRSPSVAFLLARVSLGAKAERGCTQRLRPPRA